MTAIVLWASASVVLSAVAKIATGVFDERDGWLAVWVAVIAFAFGAGATVCGYVAVDTYVTMKLAEASR